MSWGLIKFAAQFLCLGEIPVLKCEVSLPALIFTLTFFLQEVAVKLYIVESSGVEISCHISCQRNFLLATFKVFTESKLIGLTLCLKLFYHRYKISLNHTTMHLCGRQRKNNFMNILHDTDWCLTSKHYSHKINSEHN